MDTMNLQFLPLRAQKTIVTRNMDLIERLNSEIDKEKEEATAEAIALVLESSL